jgi:transposase
MDLTHTQWERIRRYLSRGPQRLDGKGRPRLDDRRIFEAILWVLHTGARWDDIPVRLGSRATCHRRFQQWCRDGSFQRAWGALMRAMDRRHRLDWSEAYIDGSFVKAKKGASEWKRPAAA